MKRKVQFGVMECLGLQRVLGAYTGMDMQRSIADDLTGYFELNDARKAEVSFREMRPDEKLAMGLNPDEARWRWDTAVLQPWMAEISDSEFGVLQEALTTFKGYSSQDRWRIDFKAQLAAPKEQVK